jgi:hypothetical protein
VSIILMQLSREQMSGCASSSQAGHPEERILSFVRA